MDRHHTAASALAFESHHSCALRVPDNYLAADSESHRPVQALGCLSKFLRMKKGGVE
jgi:hypothetical protein